MDSHQCKGPYCEHLYDKSETFHSPSKDEESPLDKKGKPVKKFVAKSKPLDASTSVKLEVKTSNEIVKTPVPDMGTKDKEAKIVSDLDAVLAELASGTASPYSLSFKVSESRTDTEEEKKDDKPVDTFGTLIPINVTLVSIVKSRRPNILDLVYQIEGEFQLVLVPVYGDRIGLMFNRITNKVAMAHSSLMDGTKQVQWLRDFLDLTDQELIELRYCFGSFECNKQKFLILKLFEDLYSSHEFEGLVYFPTFFLPKLENVENQIIEIVKDLHY